jgi:hypothetical protein
MRAYIALLGLLALISIVIQPAMAVKFSIYVYDKERNTPVQNAFVQIWQDNNLLDSGYTDNAGIFVTYLNDNTRYHIRAEYTPKWDENFDYLVNSDRITLYLHN